MDCTSPDSSVHVLYQARLWKWIVISFSRVSSRPRVLTHVSCLAGEFFTIWPPGKPTLHLVVKWLNCVWLFDTMDCSKPGSHVLYISWVLLRFTAIESMMLSNHLILCLPPSLLLCVFPSIRVFSSELAIHIRWPKHWSFSCSISPSNEYSELISFGIDRFDLLDVQGTLKSLLLKAPQFERINSLVLSLLYGPTLTCTWWLERS